MKVQINIQVEGCKKHPSCGKDQDQAEYIEKPLQRTSNTTILELGFLPLDLNMFKTPTKPAKRIKKLREFIGRIWKKGFHLVIGSSVSLLRNYGGETWETYI